MTEWRPIPGFPGYYVTSEGRVLGQRGREIAPSMSCGYLRVYPVVSGKKVGLLVHRAVALAFIPNPGNRPQVNHIDGNKANPHFLNLEWCTEQENARHAISAGLTIPPASGPGSKSPAAKLTNEQVQVIRQRLAAGEKLAVIARDYAVRPTTIGHIRNGTTWKPMSLGIEHDVKFRDPEAVESIPA